MVPVLTKDNNLKKSPALCRRKPLLELLQLRNEVLESQSGLPIVPALPKSILQLQMLLSEGVPDLEALAQTIRNDIGLTLELLKLAAREIDGCTYQAMSVSDLVVLAGFERLETMAAECASIIKDPRDSAHVTACEQFWMHSRLTAHVAEELSFQTSDVSRDEAYLAGLFYQLSALPLHLGWNVAAMPTRDLGELVFQLVTRWKLPPVLADVIRGQRVLCQTAKSRVLLDLATAASVWAYRLEFLAARESQTLRARNTPHTNRPRLER